MQGNNRFQIASQGTQPPQLIQQQSFKPNTSTQQTVSKSNTQSATSSTTATIAPMSQSYLTTAQMPQGSVFYTRPAHGVPIQFRPSVGQSFVTPANLVPVPMSPNMHYIITGQPTLNVSDIPPPPTLSPNPTQPTTKSPQSSLDSKKKKSEFLEIANFWDLVHAKAHFYWPSIQHVLLLIVWLRNSNVIGRRCSCFRGLFH